MSPDGIISMVVGAGKIIDLKQPTGVTVDPAGNLFIADWGNHRGPDSCPRVARRGWIRWWH